MIETIARLEDECQGQMPYAVRTVNTALFVAMESVMKKILVRKEEV